MDSLPDELIIQIFTYCPTNMTIPSMYKLIANLSLICKKWQKLLSSERSLPFWYEIMKYYTGFDQYHTAADCHSIIYSHKFIDRKKTWCGYRIVYDESEQPCMVTIKNKTCVNVGSHDSIITIVCGTYLILHNCDTDIFTIYQHTLSNKIASISGESYYFYEFTQYDGILFYLQYDKLDCELMMVDPKRDTNPHKVKLINMDIFTVSNVHAVKDGFFASIGQKSVYLKLIWYEDTYMFYLSEIGISVCHKMIMCDMTGIIVKCTPNASSYHLTASKAFPDTEVSDNWSHQTEDIIWERDIEMHFEVMLALTHFRYLGYGLGHWKCINPEKEIIFDVMTGKMYNL